MTSTPVTRPHEAKSAPQQAIDARKRESATKIAAVRKSIKPSAAPVRRSPAPVSQYWPEYPARSPTRTKPRTRSSSQLNRHRKLGRGAASRRRRPNSKPAGVNGHSTPKIGRVSFVGNSPCSTNSSPICWARCATPTGPGSKTNATGSGRKMNASTGTETSFSSNATSSCANCAALGPTSPASTMTAPTNSFPRAQAQTGMKAKSLLQQSRR